MVHRMKHEELEMHLQGLASLGIPETDPGYIKIKEKLEIIDNIPKKDWGKESTIEAVRAVDKSTVVDDI